MKLEGKTAIVTGGGRDIGRAVAEKLASEGASIAINYFSSSKGADETVEAIKNNPDTAAIPVMMYTSKGGDEYVSQARAIGASFEALDPDRKD